MSNNHPVTDNAATCGATKRFAQYVTRHRVQISVIVFACLISEDLLMGIRPHDILNVFDWHSVVGLSLIGFGVALRGWAAGTLHKQTKLTQTGPYRLIRHPLYAGSFLMMIGFCLLIGDPENIWVVLGPFCGLYVLSVRKEEKTLAAKFGDDWTNYAARTPRMLPRLLPSFKTGEWRLEQWIKNREYQAVAGVLIGLVAIEIWNMNPL